MPKSKKKKKEIDVIIVGGGIAGCVLAFHLANARLKVKVFEKQSRNEIEHDWCDSIEKKAFSYSGIPAPKGEERKRDRDHLAVLSPNLESIIHLSHYDYWIVDRKLFLERLVKSAEKAGAEFLFETEIIEPMGRGQWVVGVKKKDGSIENAQLVVDCSGKARILSSNIEVLDLNIKIEKEDLARAHRESHEVSEGVIDLQTHPIEKDILYYRYGYEKGYSWLNFEEDNILDVGAGVGKGYSDRSAKAIVNDFVNSKGNISNEMLRGGGRDIIIRRPTTMVWYGFLAVGEAACQVIPSNGCGVGSAMIAAKIAAEVVVDSLRRKEVSIDSLWEYQVQFMKERGRDNAALDMMRRQFLAFSEEDFSFLIKKGILTKSDFENLIHAKYARIGPLKMVIAFFKGISKIRLMLKVGKAISMSNRIYNHYRKMPKKYHTRRYLEWMLGQMHLFAKLEEK
ncbi:MAG: NAD(P)/FAD-dependent oxidoreductase [Candidatus Heimdallarchaeota archaeon]|nr:NAD(P)/FAD-dependent oxidoreductase [Candidatus Heimdallarchaeota archaeon]